MENKKINGNLPTFTCSHPQVWAPIIFLSNGCCSNGNHFKQIRMKLT